MCFTLFVICIPENTWIFYVRDAHNNLLYCTRTRCWASVDSQTGNKMIKTRHENQITHIFFWVGNHFLTHCGDSRKYNFIECSRRVLLAKVRTTFCNSITFCCLPRLSRLVRGRFSKVRSNSTCVPLGSLHPLEAKVLSSSLSPAISGSKNTPTKSPHTESPSGRNLSP